MTRRERIKRATAWRDLAKSDLEKARQGFDQEMASLELSIEKANERARIPGQDTRADADAS